MTTRAPATAALPGSEQPRRQGAAPERRWHRAGGQPVRRKCRAQAGDLHARPPQLAGPRRSSGDRRHVAERERAQRRRRDQHPEARRQLRLADRQPRPHLSGAVAVAERSEGRLRVAGRVLDAVDRLSGHDVLHRRQARRSGRATSSSADCAPARFPEPAISSGCSSTTSWKSCAASRCSCRCGCEFATSGRAPTSSSTCLSITRTAASCESSRPPRSRSRRPRLHGRQR